MKLALKSSPRPQQRLSPAAVSVSGGATCVGGTRGAMGSCPLRWPAPRQGETAQPGGSWGLSAAWRGLRFALKAVAV